MVGVGGGGFRGGHWLLHYSITIFYTYFHDFVCAKDQQIPGVLKISVSD